MITLIFDAKALKSLHSHNATRSGITLSAFGILCALKKHCNIALYAEVEYYEMCKMACKGTKSLRDLEFVPMYGWFEKLISRACYYKYALTYANAPRFLQFLAKVISYPFVLLARSLHLSKRQIATLQAHGEVFFSPYYAIAPEIRASQLVCFTLLHDIAPLVLSGHFVFDNRLLARLARKYLPKVMARHDFYDIVDSINPKDYYFANSTHTRNDFLRALGKQINPTHFSVSLLGYDKSIFHPCTNAALNAQLKAKYGLSSNARYIFSLCSLEPRKNLLFVIEQFVACIKRYELQDLYLLLGGAAWDNFKSILSSKISSFGFYEHKIIRVGYVDEQYLANLFSFSVCSVYLSTYEGFGLPVLESMACGCPTIASNTTSIPEVLGDGGIALSPTDANGLQEAIYRIYSDVEYRDELSRRALAQASKFSWDLCAEGMCEAFEKAIESKQGFRSA